MLSVILVSLALVVAACRGLWQRTKASFVILVPAILHFSMLNDVGGEAYYLSAGLVSLFVIALLDNLESSPLVFDLMKINMAYIVVHALGYIMWYAYWEPFVYNALCYCLFVVEFYRLLKVTKLDARYGCKRNAGPVRTDGNHRNMGAA